MHGLASPCTTPMCVINPEYSCCQPSAAARVPYICLRRSPHWPLAWPGCSGGRHKYVGSDPSSILALKYARDMSMADICVLCSDRGSRTCRRLPVISVAANDRIVRRDSSGGVGAKIASSPGCRICLATSRDLMLGLVSSPLLTSTHLTVTGGFPRSSTGLLKSLQ